MCDDDVVEGGVAFAEAGEADFEDHCWLGRDGGETGCLEDELRSLIGLTVFLHGTYPALRLASLPPPFSSLQMKDENSRLRYVCRTMSTSMVWCKELECTKSELLLPKQVMTIYTSTVRYNILKMLSLKHAASPVKDDHNEDESEIG